MNLVELRVINDGEEDLRYTFKSPTEASEMISFLSDFWPAARYILQPATH